ncbi:MAG: hypothetical protein ACI4DT_01305 [Chordicoccus sp.]
MTETKRILHKRFVKTIYVLLIFVAGVLGYFGGVHQESYTKGDKTIYGKQAVSEEKKAYDSIGVLTSDKLNQALQYYRSEYSAKDADTAYLNADKKYPGVIDLIGEVYFHNIERDERDKRIIELSDASDFYAQRQKSIVDQMNEQGKSHDRTDYTYITKAAKLMKRPLKYGWNSLWQSYFRVLAAIVILCGISAVFIGSDLFTYDRTQEMDMIMCTLSRKRRQAYFFRQMLGMVISVTVLYALCVFILSILFWRFIKLPVPDSQLQVIYPLSVFNTTVLGACVEGMLGAWIGLIAVTVIAATINYLVEKSIKTVAICAAVIFLPVLISSLSSRMPAGLAHFLSAQPANLLVPEKMFKSFYAYAIGQWRISNYMAVILNSVVWVACMSILAVLRIKSLSRKREY